MFLCLGSSVRASHNKSDIVIFNIDVLVTDLEEERHYCIYVLESDSDKRVIKIIYNMIICIRMYSYSISINRAEE